MPIEALPQSTVRAIGSTSVISDAYSVVKELVDNALDASATSLQIEISQNTVDVIQLKDNGHGISPEDQRYVCKRAFTSKIQSLDDLRNVGGLSMGFRGEALASVAEMSGILTVTTRVESEVTGQCLKYGRDGELTGTQRTSHPVGTTVRVTDFLKHIPVRRQTALKGASRTLTRIKKLLQAYAVAQPSKRLSLKVLKAKNENNNWAYAPSVDPSLSDAALKVAGTEVFSSCILKRLSTRDVNEVEPVRDPADQKDYEAIAFLPEAGFDISKVKNFGQFISVDGRPLSSGRGIGHEIVKVFKSYIRVAASKNESSKSVTDPFLCLQLRCPRGTYDVNIEPAKDDLLFEDRELVLTLVESLFSGYYGELERPSKSDTRGTKEKISNSTEGSTGFELLLAQKSTAKPVTDPHDSGSPLNETLPHISLSQRPLRGDPVCSTADHSNNGLSESLNPSPAARTKRSSFVNPWSISKINASFQTPQRNNNTSAFTSPVNLPSGSLQHSVQRGSEPGSLQDSPNLSDLTSPPTSRLASGSPVRRRRQHPQTSNESSPEGTRIPTARRADRDRDRDHYGNGALDTWFQKTTQASLQEPPVEEAYPQGPNNSSLSVLAHRRFGAPVNSSPSQAHVDGQNDGCSENSPQTNFSPEASPRDPALCEDQARYLPESMDSGRGFPVLDRWAAQLHKDIACEEPSDLEKALDFERRKKEAIKKSRIRFTDCENPSNSQSTTVSHSPHHSRYLAAKAALTSSQTSIAEPVSMTKLSPHDPRAYLLRQNRDSSAGENLTVGEKVRKTPTHRLPFERIPGDSNLHNLGITCSVDLSPDSDILRRSIPGDVAITNDNAPTAFSASTIGTCLPLWNERLMLIMKEQYKSTKEQDLPDMDIDLSPIMIRHLKDLDASGQ